MHWTTLALLSALFAGLTAVLAKVGVATVPSNVATLVRTLVVVGFAAGIVAARGEMGQLRAIPTRGWVFLILSGVATGLSWLCYFAALKAGPVSGVAPDRQVKLPDRADAWLRGSGREGAPADHPWRGVDRGRSVADVAGSAGPNLGTLRCVRKRTGHRTPSRRARPWRCQIGRNLAPSRSNSALPENGNPSSLRPNPHLSDCHFFH